MIYYRGSDLLPVVFLVPQGPWEDGNGNGNFEEIDSNDFQDGNWESMEMKG